ncbi:hypothetical protein [Agaribacterium sp. ZY112]|uniref:hypothetical protein n=1 Tax=Agaribacterium sp. ZY112 TaxID=3233574 RepID=UPI0035247E75
MSILAMMSLIILSAVGLLFIGALAHSREAEPRQALIPVSEHRYGPHSRTSRSL